MEVKAICLSEKRGTAKAPVNTAMLIADFGIKGDAHGGKWHRQISLLSEVAINEFKKIYPNIGYGSFGENIVISGCQLNKLRIGSKIIINDCVLEVTQIGKECHSDCEIAKKTGKCIMPEMGIFARVIKGGEISVGNNADIKEVFFSAAVTISDSSYKGEREDKSGPLLAKLMSEDGFNVISQSIIPDDYNIIAQSLKELSQKADLIITTGGTGLSQRDNTPEATMSIADKNVPGIAEAIRYGSMKHTKKAMLGRGAAVTRGETLIINFPGSPKAVNESYEIIQPILNHGLGILKGTRKG